MSNRTLGLAILAGALLLTALAAMAVGELLVAGACFLSMSLVIFLRERNVRAEN